ncbi:MAG: pSer/pThr/pTyr-binding forkhead associated (FHA) protein [Pseudohongiellaceae bacterium]|jgi:pSer/pThr/pTyr-binding forkhead associated (FHA) protein
MTGKLEFSFNSSKLGNFPLDKEVMTIGRREDNDIRIENLAVSGHHAKLLTIFEDSFLEDLSSTNGTYVNGRSIEKHPLRNGDVIIIGKHELRYVNDATSLGEDAEKTVLIRRKPESMPRLEPKIDIPPRLDGARLQILNGRSAGRELPLVKGSVKLGKAGGEIVQINKRPDGHFIVYLDQSANESAPRINGHHLGSRAVKLHNHDVIEINRLKIEYYLAG